MRRGLIFGLTFVLAACGSAFAQSYPTKPIRVIIPFGAGSATDIIPRIVFDQLSSQLGQPIIVENRAGAGGTILLHVSFGPDSSFNVAFFWPL